MPIVADMSSNILAARYNVEDFALIYAGAQKNIGPAGVTVVIVREDFLNDQPQLSAMLDYRIQAEAGSLYNTPPCFNIYISKLVFDWVKNEIGGVDKMRKFNVKNQVFFMTISNHLISTPILLKMPRIVLSATFHLSHQVKTWMPNL